MPRNLGPDLTEDVRDGPPPPLDGFAMLPVWVEAGYDGGRFAGWVPSVPGVLAVADSHARAISLAVTNTARVRGWLEAHDDEAGIPRMWRGELAGEVEATTDGDYEVNATLPTDRRVVDDVEVATAIRRLGWARDDLLDVAGRIAALEAGGGALPTNDERGERHPDEVAAPRRRVGGLAPGPVAGRGSLRGADGRRAGHGRAGGVAGVGRGPPRRRSAAPTTGPRPRTATARRGRWPRSCAGSRPTASTTCGSSSAASSGSTAPRDRIEVVLDRFPETGQVVGLLRSVGWDLRASEPASLERALRGTTEFATAWDGDRLIGTARSISDGAQNALIATVVVDPAYQGLGVGERMMHLLTDGRELVRFSLAATPGLEPWYRKLGFLPDTHALFRPRRRG